MAVSSTQEKRGQQFLIFFKGAHISMKTFKNHLLTFLRPQESGYVESISGSNATIGRMASMGITQGVAVLMIRNNKRSPLIIDVRDTFVALGRSAAARIQIRKIIE